MGRKSFIIAGGDSQVARSGQQLIPVQFVAPGRHENIADIIMVEARPYSPEIKSRCRESGLDWPSVVRCAVVVHYHCSRGLNSMLTLADVPDICYVLVGIQA